LNAVLATHCYRPMTNKFHKVMSLAVMVVDDMVEPRKAPIGDKRTRSTTTFSPSLTGLILICSNVHMLRRVYQETLRSCDCFRGVLCVRSHHIGRRHGFFSQYVTVSVLSDSFSSRPTMSANSITAAKKSIRDITLLHSADIHNIAL